MAKNSKQTSRTAASKASKVLRAGRYSHSSPQLEVHCHKPYLRKNRSTK